MLDECYSNTLVLMARDVFFSRTPSKNYNNNNLSVMDTPFITTRHSTGYIDVITPVYKLCQGELIIVLSAG